MRKLRSKAGETLVESLAAILIFTFASIVLLSLVCTASDLNQAAAQADQDYIDHLLTAELAEGAAFSGTATLTIGGEKEEIPVEVYGDGPYAFYGKEGGR